MKAIMISIKPKWCAKIMNGEKTIEVRKNRALANAIQKLIDEQGFADIYVYCTKDNHQLVKPKDYDKYLLFTKGAVNYSHEHTLNGKVVFKFRCYKIEEIKLNLALRYFTESMYEIAIATKSCLSSSELFNYLHTNTGYAIHISDLEIFDEPKELSEFNHWTDKKIQWYSVGEKVKVMVSLTNAPQSWCYVEIGKEKYDYEINK